MNVNNTTASIPLRYHRNLSFITVIEWEERP